MTTSAPRDAEDPTPGGAGPDRCAVDPLAWDTPPADEAELLARMDHELALMGYVDLTRRAPVLAVDLDPQGNAGAWLQ
ncbi:hypothetical protein [Catenulispora subtropica]|uniref:hypothetical protein n=1 Tax=Catenulispora subtropica TaxID=450798 RepID=UPI0031DAE95D